MDDGVAARKRPLQQWRQRQPLRSREATAWTKGMSLFHGIRSAWTHERPHQADVERNQTLHKCAWVLAAVMTLIFALLVGVGSLLGFGDKSRDTLVYLLQSKICYDLHVMKNPWLRILTAKCGSPSLLMRRLDGRCALSFHLPWNTSLSFSPSCLPWRSPFRLAFG